ncbi:MAG: HU family DNA-binding protein [Phycisphaerae bacterium]|nr:HU family DNA-binding protein [Phycisphaerae bacterium]
MIRTKNDIIKQLTERHDLDSARARRVVTEVLNGIVEATLEHGRIEIRRFGTFKVCRRASRVARNPRTNEPLRLPPRYVLTFEPSERVSNKVSQRFPSPEPMTAIQEYSYASSE